MDLDRHPGRQRFLQRIIICVIFPIFFAQSLVDLVNIKINLLNWLIHIILVEWQTCATFLANLRIQNLYKKLADLFRSHCCFEITFLYRNKHIWLLHHWRINSKCPCGTGQLSHQQDLEHHMHGCKTDLVEYESGIHSYKREQYYKCLFYCSL